MLNAIWRKQNWRKSNTRVQYREVADAVLVYQHESLIAVILPSKHQTFVSSAGFHTQVTKSRINAILGLFCNTQVYQQNRQWFYTDGRPFVDAPLEEILSLHTDACLKRLRAANDKNLF